MPPAEGADFEIPHNVESKQEKIPVSIILLHKYMVIKSCLNI